MQKLFSYADKEDNKQNKYNAYNRQKPGLFAKIPDAFWAGHF